MRIASPQDEVYGSSVRRCACGDQRVVHKLGVGAPTARRQLSHWSLEAICETIRSTVPIASQVAMVCVYETRILRTWKMLTVLEHLPSIEQYVWERYCDIYVGWAHRSKMGSWGFGLESGEGGGGNVYLFFQFSHFLINVSWRTPDIILG